jgi:hypothetical protein
MKTCPTCHRTYSDETISFCLEDGTVLSAPHAAQPTQPYPASRITEPPATQVMPPAPQSQATMVAPPPIITRDDRQIYQPDPGRNRWPLIVGAMILVAIVGVILAVVAGVWMINRNSSAGKQTSDTGNPREAAPKSSSSQTPESRKTSVVPEPTRPSPKLEMSGTWVGSFDEYPSRLVITENDGNSFTGTLSGKTFEIIVQGELNPDTRALNFREIRVIRDKSWVLGTNAGTMSPDGRKITGKGKATGSYSWTFSRQ